MSQWRWRDFSKLNKNWKYGQRGEWYKIAPLKTYSNPIYKSRPNRFVNGGWHIPIKYVAPPNWILQEQKANNIRWRNWEAAVKRRNERQAFYKKTNTKPKYVIKIK